MIGLNTQEPEKSKAHIIGLIKSQNKTQMRHFVDTTRHIKSGLDHPSLYIGKIVSLDDHTQVKVTGIRYQRIQDISEADARAEGMQLVGRESMMSMGGTDLFEDYSKAGWGCWTAKESFKSLVVACHGQNAWDKNDWVWVIDFKYQEAANA